MAYSRVIPRDLFNEADLLKCLGALWIATERLPAVDIEHDGGAFLIEQDEADGSLRCANVTLRLFEYEVRLFRPLNSRQPFPLYAMDGDDAVRVFTDGGALSQDFLSMVALGARGVG